MFESLENLIDELNEKKSVKFQLKVNANAHADLIDFSGELIRMRIKAPRVEGKANKAIIEYLSKMIGVAKNKVKIVNGEKSSIKTISIQL